MKRLVTMPAGLAILLSAAFLPLALPGCGAQHHNASASQTPPPAETADNGGKAAATPGTPEAPTPPPPPVNPAAYAHFAIAVDYEIQSTQALFMALRGRHIGNMPADEVERYERESVELWTNAERELARAIALDPHTAFPLIYWGEQLLRRDQAPRAADVLRRAARLPIDDVDLAFRLARMMSESPSQNGPGLRAEAIPVYESIVAAPGSEAKHRIEAFVYLALAERYEERGDLEKAVAMVQAFLDIPAKRHDLYVSNERYFQILTNPEPLVRQMARYQLRLERPEEALATLGKLPAEFREDTATRLLEARALTQLGRHGEAFELARRQAEAETDRGQALLLYSVAIDALLEQGKLVEALAELARAAQQPAEFDALYNNSRQAILNLLPGPAALHDALIDAQPELLQSPYVHFVIGQAADEAGNEALAEKHFKQALAIDRAFFRSAWELGRSLTRQGRYDEAFELALENSRIQSGWQINLRELLAQLPAEMAKQGHTEEALTLFARLLDAGDPYSRLAIFADDVLNPLTRQGPSAMAAKLTEAHPELAAESPAFNYLCGELLTRGAEFEPAIVRFRHALQRIDAADPLASRLRLSLGDALRRAGRPGEALEEFGKIRSGSDTYPAAAVSMAFIYMDRGEFGLANALIGDLIVRSPDNAWLHGVAARIAARQHGAPAGIESLKAAAARYGIGDQPAYVRSLAGMKVRLRQLDEAIALIEARLEGAEMPERHLGDLRGLLAYAHDLKGNDEKAEALYRQNLNEATGDTRPTAANSLAYFYARQGRHLDEALTLIEEALATDPANYAYIDTLGWVYYKQGRLDDALTKLRLANELSDGDGEILENLAEVLAIHNKTQEAVEKYIAAGDAYAAEGQAVEARGAYRKALEIDAARDDARAKLDALTKNDAPGAPPDGP